MGRDDSPLRDRLIFSFGVQRSGTYWLQRIIGGPPRGLRGARPRRSSSTAASTACTRSSTTARAARRSRGDVRRARRAARRDAGLLRPRLDLLPRARPALPCRAHRVARLLGPEHRCGLSRRPAGPHLARRPRRGALAAEHVLRAPTTSARRPRSGARGSSRPARRRRRALPRDPLRGAAGRPRGPDPRALRTGWTCPRAKRRLAPRSPRRVDQRNEDPSDPRVATGKWRDSFSPRGSGRVHGGGRRAARRARLRDRGGAPRAEAPPKRAVPRSAPGQTGGPEPPAQGLRPLCGATRRRRGHGRDGSGRRPRTGGSGGRDLPRARDRAGRSAAGRDGRL